MSSAPLPPANPHVHSPQASLKKQVAKQKWAYIAGGLLLAILQALMALRDNLLRVGIDRALSNTASHAAWIAAAIALTVMVAAGIRILSRIAIFHAGRNAEFELRAELLAHIHRLGLSYFQSTSTGDIMSRATNDLGQVRLLLGFGALNLLNTGFAIASALFVMLSISGRLTLAALVPVPLLMLITRIYGKAMFGRTTENQVALGQLSTSVQRSLAGLRVVRAFSLEKLEQAKFDEASEAYLTKTLALARLRGALIPTVAAISALGMLIVFWYGGSLLLRNEISEGDFIAFWAALGRLTWPILAFGLVLSILQRGRAGFVRIKEILDTAPDIVDGNHPPHNRLTKELKVQNLSFRYGQDDVLHDVSFSLHAGSSLAIVGGVGSGKSTLASLLARLLPTPRGCVFIDGVDVCELPLQSTRTIVGYAQQDAFLFSTTVARNIAFALADPDAEQSVRKVHLAAREAHVHDDILRLPDQWDSIVGERGIQLSGGQKQRVALARAFAYEPSLLILDDPLSAVDLRTEQAILASIGRQASERTLILITSRIAAAQVCERVLVLDKGTVAEFGTHETLLNSGGLYAQFAEEQRLEREIRTLGVSETTP